MGLFDDLLETRAGQGLLSLLASGASEEEIAQQLAGTQRLKDRQQHRRRANYKPDLQPARPDHVRLLISSTCKVLNGQGHD